MALRLSQRGQNLGTKSRSAGIQGGSWEAGRGRDRNSPPHHMYYMSSSLGSTRSQETPGIPWVSVGCCRWDPNVLETGSKS